MSLKGDILNSITNNLIGVSCDNCYNKDKCPQEQKLEEGTCVDWTVSDDLAVDITDDIMDLICKSLGVR